jgi:hypothetical protein
MQSNDNRTSQAASSGGTYQPLVDFHICPQAYIHIYACIYINIHSLIDGIYAIESI